MLQDSSNQTPERERGVPCFSDRWHRMAARLFPKLKHTFADAPRPLTGPRFNPKTPEAGQCEGLPQKAEAFSAHGRK